MLAGQFSQAGFEGGLIAPAGLLFLIQGRLQTAGEGGFPGRLGAALFNAGGQIDKHPNEDFPVQFIVQHGLRGHVLRLTA